MHRAQTIINHLNPHYHTYDLPHLKHNPVSSSQIQPLADIGLIGLAVMGENLVLNMASKGFRVACFNRTVSKVDEFIQGRAKSYRSSGGGPGSGNSLFGEILGCKSVAALTGALKKPRIIMIMVRAGSAVDAQIEQLLPFLENGDIVIDGGNSNYVDTQQRIERLNTKGIRFLGVGVSGGEEGALNGPSIMPGGSYEAWECVKLIFQKISAKVEDGSPCCDYVGEGGSGHFVKMVHNGIEYGDMQLIAETYLILKHHVGLNNEEISQVFDQWNRGDLESYLIEITRDIFRKKDEETGHYVIDIILDAAGQKGTGKWTVESGLDFGAPVTLIAEAVFGRVLSSLKAQRVVASTQLQGPHNSKTLSPSEKKQIIQDLHDALYAAKIVSYAQGFVLLRAAAAANNWKLNYGAIALMWRGGCIIRSKFLAKIKDAFERNPDLDNLLLDNFFRDIIHKSQAGWRRVCATAALNGYAIPAIYSAISYYDGLRTARSTSNLIQAQRDFFGAHTYERVDKPKGTYYHTNWSGQGGSTSSSVYNA